MQIFLTYIMDNNEIPSIKPPRFSKKEKVLYHALVDVVDRNLPVNSESVFEVAGRDAMVEFIDYVNELDYIRIKSKYLLYEDRYLD